jgi:microsomal dipeptidase-like Zn-dependent dipeptidase
MKKKRLNGKLLAIPLVMSMGFASPAHAGWFDDAIDWVEGAAEDTVDWVEGAVETVEDTYEDFVNTLDTIGTWFTGEENVLGYYPSAGENPVHSLAQQCFSIQSPVTGKYFRLNYTGGVIDDGMSYASDALTKEDAARFFFKPSSLGHYMMRDAEGRYLAGIIPGEMTAGTYAGKFAEFDTTAHEQADGTYLYRFHMIGLDQVMRNNYSQDKPYFIDPINPGDANSEPYFKLISNTGCADFPEITTNVAGSTDVLKGDASEPVRGFVDPHTHITSYEFMGGKFMHGKPFSRWGVEDALKDSEIVHGPDGSLDIIGNLQAYGDVNFRYDTAGYPDFPFWPNAKQLSHMGYYHKWMERAWLGGQRIVVTHLVENEVLCNLQKTVNPASWINPNSCNTMDSIRLQINRMREMEEYIDAQAGGRGKGFFRVVASPEDAREVIADGKLAVIMGVEASEVFNCGEKDSCTYTDVDRQLNELHGLGIRALFPAHKFDNRLSGSVVEDGLMNIGEWLSTGHFFHTGECDAETSGEHMTSGFPELGSEPVIGDVINALVPNTPTYDPSIEHCNSKGLTDLGRYLVERMINKGMLIEMDHMSDKAATTVLDIAEAHGYSGLVSSHSWMPGSKTGELHYNMKRVIQAGGFVSPYNSDANSITNTISQYLDEVETTPYLPGVGFSTDMSGLGGQAGPRYDGATNPLQYPFTTEFGLVVDKQKSGNRTFDISNEGVAHYGLVADHLQDIRVNGTARVYESVMNSAEAYLQMWERAEASKGIQKPLMMNYSQSHIYDVEGNFGSFTESPDAIVSWNNNKSYILKGDHYWRFDNSSRTFDAGYPATIQSGFGGYIGSTWNQDLDAAVQWDGGTVYFFKGDEYVGMSMATEATWGPKKISVGWGMTGQYASFASGIDAAINWGNGKIYLFKGDEFVRYDMANDMPDLGPLPIVNNIDSWGSWALPVGAATNNGYKMLFENKE